MCEHMWWIFPKLFCCFSSSMLYSFAQDSDSRTNMPPRPWLSQPEWSFLAMEFHRRRGTKNFLPGLLVDFAAKFPTRWRRLTLQWWEEQWWTWRPGQWSELLLVEDISKSRRQWTQGEKIPLVYHCPICNPINIWITKWITFICQEKWWWISHYQQ